MSRILYIPFLPQGEVSLSSQRLLQHYTVIQQRIKIICKQISDLIPGLMLRLLTNLLHHILAPKNQESPHIKIKPVANGTDATVYVKPLFFYETYFVLNIYRAILYINRCIRSIRDMQALFFMSAMLNLLVCSSFLFEHCHQVNDYLYSSPTTNDPGTQHSTVQCNQQAKQIGKYTYISDNIAYCLVTCK